MKPSTHSLRGDVETSPPPKDKSPWVTLIQKASNGRITLPKSFERLDRIPTFPEVLGGYRPAPFTQADFKDFLYERHATILHREQAKQLANQGKDPIIEPDICVDFEFIVDVLQFANKPTKEQFDRINEYTTDIPDEFIQNTTILPNVAMKPGLYAEFFVPKYERLAREFHKFLQAGLYPLHQEAFIQRLGWNLGLTMVLIMVCVLAVSQHNHVLLRMVMILPLAILSGLGWSEVLMRQHLYFPTAPTPEDEYAVLTLTRLRRNVGIAVFILVMLGTIPLWIINNV